MKPYFETELGKLYHGDCLEIIPQLDPVDLVLTDPPYGKQTHGKHLSSVSISNSRQTIDFEHITQDQCVELANIFIKKCRGWAVFNCEWHYMEALHKSGVLIRFGIWRKRNGAPQFTGDRPGMGWEAIAICHGPGRKRWNGGGKHAFYDYPKHNESHPTAKPIGLFIEIIQDFSNVNNCVLDPFLGSGTTAVACEQLNRRWIGIEISEKYCEIAAKRIERERQQLKMFGPEPDVVKPKQKTLF